MNNEIAPVLDMLEELKQECKAISKAQAELRTTTQETVQIHLSKETQAKIKEHQLFILEALSQSARNSTQSLKPCSSSSVSNKSP